MGHSEPPEHLEAAVFALSLALSCPRLLEKCLERVAERRVSVEIRWKLVESLCETLGLPFNGGDACVGHRGAGEAFAKSAGSKEDGSGRGQNVKRRLTGEAPAASFYFAGLIEGRRECRQARSGADWKDSARV